MRRTSSCRRETSKGREVYPKVPEQIKAVSELRMKVLRDLTKIKTQSKAALQHLQHELSRYEEK